MGKCDISKEWGKGADTIKELGKVGMHRQMKAKEKR